MEAEFNSTQRFVPPLAGIFLEMAKIGHFAFKVQFSTISKCIITPHVLRYDTSTKH